MKLIELYNNAVKKGMSEDLRSGKIVEKALRDERKAYKNMKGHEKAVFDKERLVNPYSDSRLLFGDPKTDVKTVMVGIDIDVSEIVLADRLREKGTDVDLVISHHPSGKAFAQLDKVMSLQSDVWESYGLSPDVSKGIMSKRMEEVARGLSSSNHQKVVDAARILGIPFMCLHTVADNCVANYLQKLFNKKRPKKLKNVVDILMSIHEYRNYARNTGIAPSILAGGPGNDAGKVFVDMTGGTNGPDRVMTRLSQSGIKTIVGMHIKESGFKTVSSEFLNYVTAGHISSDTLGMNLLFDAIDRKKELKFIDCSGFKRISR